MDDKPAISIVINSYNQAQFLETTIKSVLAQIIPEMEVVLVDGGSTDGSLAIIHKYSESFSWWISEKDEGQADGINKGLRRAKGDLVAWLNSDDTYQPGTIARVLEIRKTHPHASLIYGDVLAIDEDDKPIQRIPGGSYSLRDLCSFHIINQPAVFMNREVLDSVGYLDPMYHYLLDHHLWLKMGLHGEIIHAPEIWACGRFHKSAKNIKNAEKFGNDAYRIANWLLDDPVYSEVTRGISKDIQAGACRMDARYLLDAGKYKKSLSAYMNGMRYSPRIVLPEWHRMVYALLGMTGLGSSKNVFYTLRKLFRNEE